jgi:hypothetical protein
MSPVDIAAYIGAAAWAPQIVSWIYQWYVTPQIEVVTGRFASLGYTRFGPIFNLNLGFFAKRKAALIDSLQAVLVHEDGDRHIFQMEGMNETMSDIADASGTKTTVSKEQATLAFRVGTEVFLERFVRFQETKFHATFDPLVQDAGTAIQFERKKGGDIYSRIAGLKEVSAILDHYEKYFWWKAGTYEVTFRMASPERIKVSPQRFEIRVTQADVDSLRRNITQFAPEYENLIRAGEQGYTFQAVFWDWRSVPIAHKK